MTQETAVVDFVRDLEQPGKRPKAAKPTATVTLASGATAVLDLSDPQHRVWSEVLESLRASGEPAYLRVHSESRRVLSLLLPQKYLVVELRELPDGDLQLEFDRSHALHQLQRSHPQFDETRKLLEASRDKQKPLLVTCDLDGSTIVDVRRIETGK